MAQVPDDINPRMYPGDGEAGLADDDERSIAMLVIAKVTLEKERAEMEAQYREVRAIQDAEIAALDAEIEKRQAKRERDENLRLGAGDQ